jgi:hypothetical protein
MNKEENRELAQNNLQKRIENDKKNFKFKLWFSYLYKVAVLLPVFVILTIVVVISRNKNKVLGSAWFSLPFATAIIICLLILIYFFVIRKEYEFSNLHFQTKRQSTLLIWVLVVAIISVTLSSLGSTLILLEKLFDYRGTISIVFLVVLSVNSLVAIGLEQYLVYICQLDIYRKKFGGKDKQ